LQGLEHLGIEIDGDANARHAEVISRGECAVRVVKTDEDLMIARHTRQALL
jgi:acetate kinase